MNADRDRKGSGPLAAAALPDRMDSWRVLTVGGTDEAEQLLEVRDVGEFVSCEAPTEDLFEDGRTFELIHLAEGLDGELHPLAVGAWAWRLTAPGAIIVVEGTVLDDSSMSQYAEFTNSPDGDDRWSWVPGRLTFRWMIENSGFDFEDWLEVGGDAAIGCRAMAFQARRVDRLPGLDLWRQPLGR